MLPINHESGESSSSMMVPLPAVSFSPSMPPPTILVAGRIDQMATQFGGAQNKWRQVLSVLEKYVICTKWIESKANERMKLDEFARLFPGMRPYSSLSS